MDKLELTDDMKSGIELIDRQHQIIAEEINKLLSHPDGTISREFVRASLSKVTDLLKTHFSEEEKVLKDLGISIPVASDLEHKSIINSLDNFVGKLEEDYCISDELRLFVIGMLSAYMRLEAAQIRRDLEA